MHRFRRAPKNLADAAAPVEVAIAVAYFEFTQIDMAALAVSRIMAHKGRYGELGLAAVPLIIGTPQRGERQRAIRLPWVDGMLGKDSQFSAEVELVFGRIRSREY